MMMLAGFLALSLQSAVLSMAHPADHDAIASLPGWDAALPSRMWSGYVDVSANMDRSMLVHYWFIESEGSPDTDPVILWTNGGPGASSMFGVLVELGPLLLNENSLTSSAFNETGIPTLYRNQFSWSRLGSILMFDWPPPVGFSYCGDDATGDGKSCGDWDDSRMANLTYAALHEWYEKFPERKSNDLFLTGESYAGIYVPKLAQQILAHNDSQLVANLKGFAVGDGCLGSETTMCGSRGGPWFTVLFLYGHGQISNGLFDAIVETCGMDYLKYGGKQPEGCSDLVSEVGKQAGGYYGYNLYDDCTYQNSLGRLMRMFPHASSELGLVQGAVNDYVCGGGPAQNVWINQTSVRKALNVPVDSNFFSGDNGDGMVYHLTEKNLMPFYRNIAQNTNLRVLIYNGDTDPGLNSQRADNWTSSLGFTPSETWRPWTLDGCRRVGGYVTRYGQARLDFLTIRGSGHMVPQFKPEQAFEFMRVWVKGEEYRPYVKDCVAPPPYTSRARQLESWRQAEGREEHLLHRNGGS